MSKDEEILIECRCGKKWWIDYVPTPDGCEDDIWRIWLGDVPGIWVDPDGNEIKPGEVHPVKKTERKPNKVTFKGPKK